MIYQVVYNIVVLGIKQSNTNPNIGVTFPSPLSPISHPPQ